MTLPVNPKQTVPVVILAGGQGRRLGGVDKCLLPLTQNSTDALQHDVTVLQVLLSRLQEQSRCIYLNANGNTSRFADVPYPIISDSNFADAGPLAGIANVLLELQSRDVKKDLQVAHQWLISVPGDCPFIPNDLVRTLVASIQETPTDIAYCKSLERDHFVVAIWSMSILEPLLNYLHKGERSVGNFIQSQDYQCVEFACTEPALDPFFNINTAEQLRIAQEIYRKGS